MHLQGQALVFVGPLTKFLRYFKIGVAVYAAGSCSLLPLLLSNAAQSTASAETVLASVSGTIAVMAGMTFAISRNYVTSISQPIPTYVPTSGRSGSGSSHLQISEPTTVTVETRSMWESSRRIVVSTQDLRHRPFFLFQNWVAVDPTSGAVRHRFFIDSAKPQDDLVFGKLWNKVREQSGMSVEAQDAGTPKDEQKK